MVLHLIFAAMLLVAIATVLSPLARAAKTGRRPAIAGTADPVALYRLRLEEIARDLDRGLLSPVSAEAARNEEGRMLLRAAQQDKPPVPDVNGAQSQRSTLRRRRLAAIIAIVGLPAFAVPLYAFLGSPQLRSSPFATRLPAEPAKSDIATLIGQVEAHLVAHPDDGRGFEVIAPVYMRLGRYDDALRARSEAMRLLGETPERLLNLAEASMAAAGGAVSREAADEIAKALAAEPENPKARYFQALALEQDGRTAEAIAALKALLADTPADAPWRATTKARLARLEPPGDDQAAVVAGLPPAAQGEAIHAMVEGLAARLDKQGGTADEWARLVRSYAVLGERDKALAALSKARAALPDKASRDALLQVAIATGLEKAP
jgi:cytochrome c-type biogenesis protein CcmH